MLQCKGQRDGVACCAMECAAGHVVPAESRACETCVAAEKKKARLAEEGEGDLLRRAGQGKGFAV